LANDSLGGASPDVTHKEGKAIIHVASLFNQLLQHFPRTEFGALVKENDAEWGAKGFGCWTQLVSMLFCQLAHADSLREICNGLGCCLGKLVHLGIAKAPNKSTLSYANSHRPAKLYEDLFYTALNRFRDEAGLGQRKKKFRFKNKLLSLDSTTISLCLELFPWAKFRRAKGGVKAHVLLDHDDYLPRYVLITEAQRSDVTMADAFTLNPGSIVAMDRGYNDYGLFGKWTVAEIYFVTRLKENAVYEVAEECAVPQDRHIRSDPLIRFTGVQAQKDCPCLLRRVVVWDAENEREIVLLNQPAGVWRHNHCRHLQGPLGDRAVLQGAQTKPQGEQLRRHQRKRAAHPDLDSLDRDPAAEMVAPSVEGQMVPFQSRLHAADEPVYLSRFADLAGQPLRDTAPAP